ncbi:MAG: DUF305 domain-containing protein [Gemmatimonadaceae bacterium]
MIEAAILSRPVRSLVLMLAGIFVTACSSERESPGQDTALPTTAPAAGADGESEADKEFLAKMIGHHSGMLVMAEAAMASATGQAKSDAQTVHHTQAIEIDSMSSILSNRYMTMITPAVSAEARMMADSLKKLSGAPAAHAFYDMTIQHHRAATAMVDEYLPRLSPQIRAMASKMKTDQTTEITAFQRKAGDAHPARP